MLFTAILHAGAMHIPELVDRQRVILQLLAQKGAETEASLGGAVALVVAGLKACSYGHLQQLQALLGGRIVDALRDRFDFIKRIGARRPVER